MSFSRLQLAAALIEYDNDDPDRQHTRKDHTKSAIFNTQRQRPGLSSAISSTTSHSRGRASHHEAEPSTLRHPQTQRFSSALSTHDGTQSMLDPVESRDMGRGIETLNQPPQEEVDLGSWGIPETLLASQQNVTLVAGSQRREQLWRPQSFREARFAETASRQDEQEPQEQLRPLPPSLSDAISNMQNDGSAAAGTSALRRPLPRPPALKGSRPSRRDRTVSFHEFTSPNPDTMVEAAEIERPGSSMSMLDRGRFQHPAFPDTPVNDDTNATHSLEPDKQEELADPSEISRPGSSSSVLNRGRFQHPAFPHAAVAPSQDGLIVAQSEARSPHSRQVSFGSTSQTGHRATGSGSSQQPLVGDPSNPFAMPAPAGPRASRFDPKLGDHTRQSSQDNGLGHDQQADARKDHDESLAPVPRPTDNSRRAVGMTMFRPKTLIMPTPLQGTIYPSSSAPLVDSRGFLHGKKPMPLNAVRPASLIGSLPTMGSMNTLSLSQRIFSDSLPVDGARGKFFVGGAQEEGHFGLHAIGGRDSAVYVDERDVEHAPGAEDWRTVRPVPGLSLMDKLEEKKAMIQSQKRQFMGDSRPTMMTRDDESRHTLFDLVKEGPTSPESRLDNASMRGRNMERGDRGRSVFGVDQVWQREVAKLRLQQDAERPADELSAVPLSPHDYELEADVTQWGFRGHQLAYPADQGLPPLPVSASTQDTMTTARTAPVLPPILTAAQLAASQNRHDDIDHWGASSDEEDVPRRRARPQKKTKDRKHGRVASQDVSSDDDAPLTQLVRADKRVPYKTMDDDSSEDEPLSRLVAQAKTPVMPATARVTTPVTDVEDEDDVPLAVRRMTMLGALVDSDVTPRPPATGVFAKPHQQDDDDDDDDLPLGQKHVAAAQAQQMQRQSAFYHHQQYMMGGNVGPAPAPMMMGMPMMNPYMMGMNPSMMSMPPMGFEMPQDPAIDRWRREVDDREGSVYSGAHQGRQSVVM